MTKLMALLLALFSLTPAATWAQQPAATAPADVYVVQPDDTLWDLSGFHKGDARLWRALADANPFLREPGRIFERDGKIIALIRPGEELVGLGALGILPRPIPLPEPQTPPQPSSILGFLSFVFGRYPWRTWLLLALLIIGIVALVQLLRRSRARRASAITESMPVNPMTAGPPFVPMERGRDPELVARTFDRHAEREAGRRDPTGIFAGVRPERLGPIEEGRLTANCTVQYADGSSRQLQLVEQRAYRAHYRMPSGEEIMLYSLYGCMNPVSLFREDEGFVWQSGAVAVPAPPHPPAAEPGAPASVPGGIVATAPADLTGATALHSFTYRVPVTVRLYVDGQGRLASAVSLSLPSEAPAPAAPALAAASPAS